MSENRKKEINKYILLFIIIESILYFVFMFIDISNIYANELSNYLKFLSIVFCFVILVFQKSGDARRKDVTILRVAMFFTVVSDLFLLLFDYYDLGVMTFCIVQILYLVKLSDPMKRSDPDLINQRLTQVLIKLIRNIILSFVLLFVLIISKIEIELLLIITIFYFVSIVMNVIDAVILNRKVNTIANKLFAYGMILFLLCDINVGIFNLANFVTINNKFFITLYDFSTIGMWMFYLPAQVLIALSGFAQNTTDKQRR